MDRLKTLGLFLTVLLATTAAACTPTAAGPGWTFTPAAPGTSQPPATSAAPGDAGAVLGTVELVAIDIGYEQPT